MGSTELNETGTPRKGDSLEVSDDTPMYNPLILILRENINIYTYLAIGTLILKIF